MSDRDFTSNRPNSNFWFPLTCILTQKVTLPTFQVLRPIFPFLPPTNPQTNTMHYTSATNTITSLDSAWPVTAMANRKNSQMLLWKYKSDDGLLSTCSSTILSHPELDPVFLKPTQPPGSHRHVFPIRFSHTKSAIAPTDLFTTLSAFWPCSCLRTCTLPSFSDL